MTDSDLSTIDAIIDIVGAPHPRCGLEVGDATYMLEATFGEMAPVIAIVRAHQAAIADEEADIQFWVKVYLALEGERRRH